MDSKKSVLKAIENSNSWHSLLGVMGNCFGMTLDEQLATYNRYPNTVAAMKKLKWEQLGYEVDENSCYKVDDYLYCNIENVKATEQSTDIPLWYYDKVNENEIVNSLKDKKLIPPTCNTIDDAINSYCNRFTLKTNNSELQILFKSSLYDLLSNRILKVDRNIEYSFANQSLDDVLLVLNEINRVVSPFLRTYRYISTKNGKCVNYTFDEQNSIAYNQDENNIKEEINYANNMPSNIRREGLEPSVHSSNESSRRGPVREDRGLLDNSSSISEVRGVDESKQVRDEMGLDERKRPTNDNRPVSGRTNQGSSNGEIYARPNERDRGTDTKTYKTNDETRGNLRTSANRLVQICTRAIQCESKSNGSGASRPSLQLTLFNNSENETAELNENEPAVFLYRNFKNILCLGSGFVDGKYRIYSYYLENSKQKDRIAFLKHECGMGGASYDFTDNARGDYWYDGKGLKIKYENEDVLINWSTISIVLDLLIENDMYLSDKEVEHYPTYLAELKERKNKEQFLENVRDLVSDADELSLPLRNSYYEIRRNASSYFYEDDTPSSNEVKENIFNFLKDYSNKGFENSDKAKDLLQELKDYAPNLFKTSIVSERNKLKSQHQDYIILMKNGDFYEALDSDAELTADLLSLALTTRKENGADMPLTGFPVYKFKDYIETLLQAKYPVAIANADETLNYRIVETYVPAEQNVVINTDVQALTQDDISIEQETSKEPVEVSVDDYFVSYEQKSLINTNTHRNFIAINDIVPMLLNHDISYIQLKAGESFMPLTIEKIGGNNIAIAHNYIQNGDLMCDPEIVYYLDVDKQELRPKSYQQDNMGLYKTVDNENGTDMVYEAELSRFTLEWFKNIKEQGYNAYKIALAYKDSDVRLFFDKAGKLVNIEGEYKDEYCSENNIKLSTPKDIQSQQNTESDNEIVVDNSYIGKSFVKDGTTYIIRDVDNNQITLEEEITDPTEKVIFTGGKHTVDFVENYIDELKTIDVNNTDLLNKAKNLLNRYCEKTFSEEVIDYSDLSKIPVAYSVVNKYNNTIQSFVDLVNFRIDTLVDDSLVKRQQYESLNDLVENGLTQLDFGALTTIDDNKDFYNKTIMSDAIGKVVTLDDRQFEIESINLLSSSVVLKDVTFENSKGFPIDRVEKLSVVATALNEQKEQSSQSIEISNEIDLTKIPNDDKTNLANEITMFIKDFDFYNYQDNMNVEVTDEDVVGSVTTMLENQNATEQILEFLNGIAEEELSIEQVSKLTDVKNRLNSTLLSYTGNNLDVSNENFDLSLHPIEYVGKKERFKRNIEAIKVLKNCEFENRKATYEEQIKLSKYVGWGGLSEAFDEKNTAWANEFVELYTTLSPEEYSTARESTLTAFYTPPFVIASIYKALMNFGLEQGNILEPSCGVGNFLGMLPTELKNSVNLNGVELDETSGKIAKLLYPNANIQIKGYEQTTYDDNSFDVAIGNIPFGSFSVNDKNYNDKHFLIHDYFFAKSLDKVKPGGIVAFITSKGTMDKKNPTFRKYIAKRAELVGAIRLPDDTFKQNAGTEVTSDIVFLKKRENEIEIEPNWVYVNTDDNGIEMNEYFIDNPNMVLGNMQEITTAHGVDFACKNNGENVETLLNSAIGNLHTTLETQTNELVNSTSDIITPPIPAGLKDNAFCNIDDTLYQRQNNKLVLADTKTNHIDLVKDLIVLRDTCYDLMNIQTTPISDEDVKPYQDKLNVVYDSFVAKNGRINTKKINAAFKDDPALPLLNALEQYDEEGNFVGKSDMFYKRTVKPIKHITKCDTSTDALLTCLSEKGKVDIDYIKKLTQFDEEHILEDLKGVIFKLPNMSNEPNQYVTADEYLSGNVKDKLALAKIYKQVSEQNWVDENIEALEQVQPAPLNASKIKIRLGATWIPDDIIDEFMYHLLNTSYSNQSFVKAHYVDLLGKWVIENKGWESYSTSARSVYGTKRANGYDLFEDCLNLKNAVIKDTISVDGKDKQVVNDIETRKAQAKQNLIKKEFESWIWSDQDRRKRLENIYNDKFNSNVVRKYDGSYLDLGGANCNVQFRPHQKDAIARILQGKNVLLDHCVGAGKTYVMIAAAMESKRIGLCHKSIITVPNNIVGQIASDFMFLYPNANILMATEKDFSKENRKKFCSRIATGDYDAIIMGHSQFEKIPLSKDKQVEMLEQQLEDVMRGIEEAREKSGNHITVKALERSRKSIQLRLDKLNDIEQDDVVTFEQLGVDKLFVDEAHNFKNLCLYTKMNNVAGINTTESKKATDMYNKVRYLDEITGGKGTVFATGTPISNTMAELYTMQKYLQYDRLKHLGLLNFDSWASTFGETVTELELKPEGTGFRMKERFSKFFNVPELMSIFREVADIQTKEMIKLPVPKVNYENVSCPASDYQFDMVQSLGERADAIRNGSVDRDVDNMLLITSDGRKLALDQRIINPDLPDYENSKINVCIDNVYEIYQNTNQQKGTQLIFCDLSTPTTSGFNVYDDIKTKLIDRGIPDNEIAFVHDAKTNKAKETLFKKVRKGSVRILLGSTSKCGTGTNVQERLVATHDLDCPWRPADLEQRAGRIERQGNQNKEVSIYRYVTENTFDAYMYQLVEKKQRFISQVMMGDTSIREVEDFDEASLSYAKLKALAVGDPLIQEKMELDIQVRDLLVQKQNHNSEIYQLQDDITINIPKKISKNKCLLENIQSDFDVSNSQPAVLQIGNKEYIDSKDIGECLLAFKEQLIESTDNILVGKFKGLPVELYYDDFTKGITANIGKSIKDLRLGMEKQHIGEKLLTSTEVLQERIVSTERGIDVLENSLATAKEQVNKPFPLQEELDHKQARLDELNDMFDSRDNNNKENEQERNNDFVK